MIEPSQLSYSKQGKLVQDINDIKSLIGILPDAQIRWMLEKLQREIIDIRSVSSKLIEKQTT